MKLISLKNITLYLVLFVFINVSHSKDSDYKNVIDKYFSNRQLDTIEGIWIKTYANQGPPGCVTIFYKNDKNIFSQMHIDSCFVMHKITGRQSKSSNYNYEGENAVYFYNGDINWKPSSVKISEDFKELSITHGSDNNSFREKWKRVWPKDLKEHNNSIY